MDDDRVVYLLASLPDSYNTLVTALEANTDVPKMEVVIEQLPHEEQKIKERGGGMSSSSGAEAMFSKQKATKRGPKCHFCKRYGHIQRNCADHAQAEKSKVQMRKGTLSRRPIKLRSDQKRTVVQVMKLLG